GEALDAAEHLAGGDAAFAAARIRHDAERAELVATALDRDLPAHAVVVGDPVQALVDLLAIELHVDRVLALARAFDQIRDVAVAVGPRDERDVRRALGNLFLQVLRHAARNSDDELGIVAAMGQQLARAPPDA